MRKSRQVLAAAFGRDEAGLPDLPANFSGIRLSRLIFYRTRGGCSYCFPHGFETSNSTIGKNRKSWKLHRQDQFHLAPAARLPCRPSDATGWPPGRDPVRFNP